MILVTAITTLPLTKRKKSREIRRYMPSYENETNWRLSIQRDDGQNNDYYIYPKSSKQFWDLATECGNIIYKFISKNGERLPLSEYESSVGKNISYYVDPSSRIRTTTIKNKDISKIFKNTIIIAAPKSEETALRYKANQFTADDEQSKVEAEIRIQKKSGFNEEEKDYPSITKDNNLKITNEEGKIQEEERNLQNVIYGNESAEEGKLKKITSTYYERDPKLVIATKRRDKFTCQACGFFLDKKIVETHHLNPLSNKGRSKTTVDDLITLCPTCHRIAHSLLKEDKKFIDRKILVSKIKELLKI